MQHVPNEIGVKIAKKLHRSISKILPSLKNLLDNGKILCLAFLVPRQYCNFGCAGQTKRDLKSRLAKNKPALEHRFSENLLPGEELERTL